MRGPSGDPMATPSTCWFWLPSNWNNRYFVSILSNSINSVFVTLTLYSLLNQASLNALPVRISMDLSAGTLVKKYCYYHFFYFFLRRLPQAPGYNERRSRERRRHKGGFFGKKTKLNCQVDSKI